MALRSEYSLGFLVTGLVFMIVLVMQLELINLQGDGTIDSVYLTKYIGLGWYALFCTAIAAAFSFIKEPLSANFPNLWTNDSYRPLNNKIYGIIALLVFSGLILFSVTTLKVQAVPVPEILSSSAIEQGLSISSIEQVYFSSVVPGIYEDLTWGLFFPTIVFNILWLLFFLIFKIDARQSTGLFISIMLLAIIISSAGYGILVPGFASAHKLVYQENTTAYIAAFVFMFIQATLYQLTGLFLPLAHILHNALYTVGFSTALSIGGTGGITTGLGLLWILQKRRKYLNGINTNTEK